MSYRFLFLKHGFISNNAPLKNGIGRFIPQVQRMTLKFCKEKGNSAGVRQFIERDIVQIAKAHPHVVFYLKPRRHKSPVLVTEYLNGERDWMSLHQFSRDEVNAWVDLACTHSGKEYQVQRKYEYSEYPSVQGIWNPFTNADPQLATAEFPQNVPTPSNEPLTATDEILRMFQQQQNKPGNISILHEEELEKTKQGGSVESS